MNPERWEYKKYDQWDFIEDSGGMVPSLYQWTVKLNEFGKVGWQVIWTGPFEVLMMRPYRATGAEADVDSLLTAFNKLQERGAR